MAHVEEPIEPPATTWRLPDPRRFADDAASHDLVALGADLEPGTLLAAYRLGLFPMHVQTPVEVTAKATDESSATSTRDVTPDVTVEQRLPTERIGWWSPDPRGVLELDQLQVSRSLRQSIRKYRCTVNQAFDGVVLGCAESRRDGRWINADIRSAYVRLHQLGWAHSIEVWQKPEVWEQTTGDRGSERTLVGGLYGVTVGGLFAGESMFYRARDASKVALVHLVEVLSATNDADQRLLDVQWLTEHLASLGAEELPRGEYLDRLDMAVKATTPDEFRLPRPPTADGKTKEERAAENGADRGR